MSSKVLDILLELEKEHGIKEVVDRLGITAQSFYNYKKGQPIAKSVQNRIKALASGAPVLVEDYREKYYSKLEQEESIRKDIAALQVNLDSLSEKLRESENRLSQLIVASTAELGSRISGLASPLTRKGSGKQSGKS